MSPTLAIIAFAVGLITLVIGVVLSREASKTRAAFEQAELDLEAERKKLRESSSGTSSKKKKTEDSSKQEPQPSAAPAPSEGEEELRAQVEELRGKLDKQRQKNHDITRDRDDLRARVGELEDAKPAPADQSALVDMRMELAEAKAEVETYKAKLEELEAGARKKEKKKAAEPKPEPKPAPKVAEGVASEEVETLRADYEARIESLEGELRETEKELRGKLKRLGRDVDHHRRRADNNDKAYRITQRELDAARERVRLLEEQLHKARFASTSTEHVEGEGAQEPEPYNPVDEAALLSDEPASPAVEQDAPEDVAEEHAEAGEGAPAERGAEEAAEEQAEAAPQVEELAAGADQDQPQQPEDSDEDDQVDEAVAGEDDTTAGEDEHTGEERADEAVAASASEEKEEKKDPFVLPVIEEATAGLQEGSTIDDAWSEFELDDV